MRGGALSNLAMLSLDGFSFDAEWHVEISGALPGDFRVASNTKAIQPAHTCEC